MSKPPNKSALKQSKNNPSSGNVSNTSADKIKALRKNKFSEEELLKQLLQGNKAALSRGITLIESNQPQHLKLAEALVEGALPNVHQSVRIGVTGVPGVGKSSFIEAMGNFLIGKGKRVAVLAVDPSSSLSRGSILGDKTRMENLVKEENAFIRPSPSGDSHGGVAKKTRESIILCEAAGFDVILIETVGVGQSETTVHSMTDFFLLLKLAGAGDELQGIKRGIIEMADAIVINKADGENVRAARQARLEFERALHLYPPKESEWQPKVLLSSALDNTGIPEIWKLISDFKELVEKNGYFAHNRQEQNKFWLVQTINEHLKNRFYQNEKMKETLQIQLKALENNEITAFAAAAYLLEEYNSL